MSEEALLPPPVLAGGGSRRRKQQEEEAAGSRRRKQEEEEVAPALPAGLFFGHGPVRTGMTGCREVGQSQSQSQSSPSPSPGGPGGPPGGGRFRARGGARSPRGLVLSGSGGVENSPPGLLQGGCLRLERWSSRTPGGRQASGNKPDCSGTCLGLVGGGAPLPACLPVEHPGRGSPAPSPAAALLQAGGRGAR